MNKILIIILLLISPIISTSQCLQMDIMMVADKSTSIAGNEQFIIEAIGAFIDRFELAENTTRIGVVIFDDMPTLASPLTTSKLQLKKGLEMIIGYGLTEIRYGLSAAANELIEHGRPEAKQLIILISDGGDIPRVTIPAAEAIKDMGISICSIVLLSQETNMELMNTISSDNCVTVSNYQNLIMELKAISICL